MPYINKFAKDSLILFIATILGSFLGYLLRLLLARNFTVDEYGSIYSIIALFSFFGLFVALGLNTSLPKHISEFYVNKKYKEIKGAILIVLFIELVLSIIISGLTIIFSRKIASYYLQDESIYLVVIIYSIFFIFSTIYNIVRDGFRGFQDIKMYSLMGVIQPVFVIILTYFLVSKGFGLYSLFIAYLFSSIILLIFFFYIFTKKTFKEFTEVKPTYNKKLTSKLFNTAFPILIVSSFTVLYGRVDTILLSFFTSPEQVGLYNVAFPTIQAILMLLSSFTIIMIPLISEIKAKNELNRLNLSELYNHFLVFSIPVAIFLFLYSGDIISILFGEKFIEASLALKLLSFTLVFQGITKINNSVLIGIDSSKKMANYTVVGGILNIILNIILIPNFGAVGAAIATTFSFFLIFVLSVYSIIRHIKFKFELSKYIKMIFSSIIFFVIVIFIRNNLTFNVFIDLLISALMAFLVYIFLIFKLKVISVNQVKEIILSVVRK